MDTKKNSHNYPEVLQIKTKESASEIFQGVKMEVSEEQIPVITGLKTISQTYEQPKVSFDHKEGECDCNHLITLDMLELSLNKKGASYPQTNESVSAILQDVEQEFSLEESEEKISQKLVPKEGISSVNEEESKPELLENKQKEEADIKKLPTETKSCNIIKQKDENIVVDLKSQPISEKAANPREGEPTDKENTEDNPEQPSSSNPAENQQVTPAPPKRSILQLKVTLHEIEPPIWREIQVLNNISFAKLHYYIMEAMGWQGYHSCQFYAWDEKNKTEITIQPNYFLEDDTDDILKMGSTKLSKFLQAKGDVVYYCYDLGDSWMHKIVVEEVLPPPPKNDKYPKCNAGARACPPEDCGGVDGYIHLLEVYKNPEHKEYEDLIEYWLEENFPGWDPEKFEKSKIFRKV